MMIKTRRRSRRKKRKTKKRDCGEGRLQDKTEFHRYFSTKLLLKNKKSSLKTWLLE
jgi:hypothetical protein